MTNLATCVTHLIFWFYYCCSISNGRLLCDLHYPLKELMYE